jgi:hypothetical protein
MILKGKNIVITMRTGTDSYEPFVCGTSCTMTTTQNKLELTDETIGNWKKWIRTELEGTIEVEGIVVLYNVGQFTAFDLWKAQWEIGKLDFFATMTDSAGNEFVLNVECLIDENSLVFDAEQGVLASNSLFLTMNGEPNFTESTTINPGTMGDFFQGDFSGDDFLVP